MKFIAFAVLMGLLTTTATTTRAADTPSLFTQPDAQSMFRDAQQHVKELMKTGKYVEASEYMSIYQRLACEAAEQQAGRSTEEGIANCARNNQAGMSASSVQQRQQELFAAEPMSASSLAPGISVIQRAVPGSPTFVDGSAPSLLIFDPRTDTERSGSRTDPIPTTDPWTGAR
ncbi:MAG: hypothetical protein H0X43_02540 [Nitrosospira sp.]|nr:hypothetical protein [Nitrosospira sp.]